jgi:hypothetical protein
MLLEAVLCLACWGRFGSFLSHKAIGKVSSRQMAGSLYAVAAKERLCAVDLRPMLRPDQWVVSSRWRTLEIIGGITTMKPAYGWR